MIFKILDSVRQKPKRVRDQYALGVALCTTVIIAGVWTLSLPARFSSVNLASVSSASSTPVQTTPFAGLIAQFKSQFQGMKSVMNTMPTASTTAAATTSSSSALSETEAALNLQITEENRAGLGQATTSSTSDSSRFLFATPTPHQTILIATTSNSATTTR